MFKKFLKVFLILTVVGVAAYMLYQYFTRDDRLEELEGEFDAD